jgi:hypothetical protein
MTFDAVDVAGLVLLGLCIGIGAWGLYTDRTPI